jgi:hypothetical protein
MIGRGCCTCHAGALPSWKAKSWRSDGCEEGLDKKVVLLCGTIVLISTLTQVLIKLVACSVHTIFAGPVRKLVSKH